MDTEIVCRFYGDEYPREVVEAFWRANNISDIMDKPSWWHKTHLSTFYQGWRAKAIGLIDLENQEAVIRVKGSFDQLCELEDHVKWIFRDLDEIEFAFVSSKDQNASDLIESKVIRYLKRLVGKMAGDLTEEELDDTDLGWEIDQVNFTRYMIEKMKRNLL